MSNENENLVQDMEELAEEPVEEGSETSAETPKKKKKLVRRKLKSIKKWPITLYIVLVTVGVILCLIGWCPKFTIIGKITTEHLCLPGGTIAIIAIIIEMFCIKCPYCGSRKVGRTLGFKAKIAKTVVCPDCKKKIIIK